MKKPTNEHMNYAKRIIRYIRGTIKFILVYENGKKSAVIHGYSDSDFAGDVGDRKNTSGQIFFLGSMGISWSSSKQKIVALSSCKAEYIAVTDAACQGIWLSRLIGELIGHEINPVTVKVDNQSTIILSKNPVHHSRTKHIDTRYHFIQNCVDYKKIFLNFVRASD